MLPYSLREHTFNMLLQGRIEVLFCLIPSLKIKRKEKERKKYMCLVNPLYFLLHELLVFYAKSISVFRVQLSRYYKSISNKNELCSTFKIL